MIAKSVPTYTDVFGPPTPKYDELLKEVTPGTGILYCLAINSELNAPFPFTQNQIRLLRQALSIYTRQQQLLVISNLRHLGLMRHDDAIGEIFYKNFILDMLVNELNRNGSKPIGDIPRTGQFQLLQAYFLTIETEYKTERILLDKVLAQKNEPDWAYRMLWIPLMRQFQFNEPVSPLMEMSKLFWLLKFAFDHWRDHLRVYFKTFNVKTIGQFAGSYNSLFTASAMTLSDQPLQKFVIIGDPNGARHLKHLRINELMATKTITPADLKKKPLFQLPGGQYLIIDQAYLFKHIFRGPFFDLQHVKNSSGKPISKNLISDVSKYVLEEYAFRSIIQKLNSDPGLMKFDEGADQQKGVPDCYKRIGYTILLFELKATIFPDAIWENPEYDQLLKYLEERFVQSNDGPKGIVQLSKDIENILNGGYSFDPIDLANTQELIIYPIIVHNDFQFSMHGLNQFLLDKLKPLFPTNRPGNVKIRPLTVINMDWLFDLSFRQGNFTKLMELIDRYHATILSREHELTTMGATQERFVRSYESFDLVYQFNFMQDLPNVADEPISGLEELFSFAGITQAILDTEV